MFKGKRGSYMTFVSQVRCQTSMRGVSACLSPFVPSIGRQCQYLSVSNFPVGKHLGKPRINKSPTSTVRNGKRGRLRNCTKDGKLSLSESSSRSMATKRVSLLSRISYRPTTDRSVASLSCTSSGFSLSTKATIATYKVPKVENENNVSLNQAIETIG